MAAARAAVSYRAVVYKDLKHSAVCLNDIIYVYGHDLLPKSPLLLLFRSFQGQVTN